MNKITELEYKQRYDNAIKREQKAALELWIRERHGAGFCPIVGRFMPSQEEVPAECGYCSLADPFGWDRRNKAVKAQRAAEADRCAAGRRYARAFKDARQLPLNFDDMTTVDATERGV